MTKRIGILAVLALTGLAAFAQPLAPAGLGALATVKLIKTEVVVEKSFRDDIAKLEASRGKKLTDEERVAYLDDVINDLLFYQMCERDGVKVTDAEVDTYIAKLRQQRPAGESDAQFSAFLASQGIPFADLRKYYKKQILVQRWLMTAKAAEIAAIPPVKSEDVISTYELYKAKLVRPDTVRIAFLFYPAKDKTEAERSKGAALMKGLADRLAKGENFDSLRLLSQDGGYAANKDPVYFEKSDRYLAQFGQAFFDTVFALKDGSNSALFETEAGWWIVRRLEFLPQKQLELSDPYMLGQAGTVQDYIAQMLAKQRETEFLQKTFEELFKKLRSQAEIKINGKP